MSRTPRIAVCISTFHRAEGLARVLESLGALALPDPAPRVTVVVVNNDPQDTRPAEICAAVPDAYPFEIVCLAEPERGLAAPRNRAIEHAIVDHDFIAFIDDDSVATGAWLASLLEVQRRAGAEVVTGPVAPIYEHPPPAWLERGRFFAPHSAPTGSARASAFTNNVLMSAECLRTTATRVDLRFGLIGGEDVHFFRRLRAAGASIAWADEAVVEDLVPAERMTARWLVRRHRRTGMTTALIERDLRPAVVAYPLVAAKAVVWMLLGAGVLLAGAVAGHATRVRGRCWLAWGRGLVEGLAGRFYREYLEER
ncbi:MAG: glycosyltransferase family 2 protein [Planctomycetes bacterium]|nr:glycosyltransferase family 2 protein [Planctomycetota bacterium]